MNFVDIAYKQYLQNSNSYTFLKIQRRIDRFIFTPYKVHKNVNSGGKMYPCISGKMETKLRGGSTMKGFQLGGVILFQRKVCWGLESKKVYDNKQEHLTTRHSKPATCMNNKQLFTDFTTA